ncbi:MAG: 50S ribosomal protein L2 [Nitrospirota bacterium]
MAIKLYKPTSPGRRFQTSTTLEDLTRKEPYEGLLVSLPRTGGRNNQGRMTVRYRGGGHKRAYRIIDFKRDKWGIPATVESIEYDPNRSARIALLKYADGERRYILSPIGLRVGDKLMAGSEVDIKPGNALPLKDIPVGTIIHNIELRKGQGAKLARGAGAACQIMAREGEYAQIKLPSGETRLVRADCIATIGQIGNIDHGNISLGKAGRSRWLGRRPKVRGVAMNPVDHPLGGGEGKTSGGRPAVSPWGRPEGVKTRRKKPTDKFIIKRRK